MQDHEFRALLGDAYETLDEDTREALREVIDACPESMQEAPDFANGAMMLAFGDTTIEDLSDRWQQATAVMIQAREELIGAVRMARALGESEYSLSERARVTRMTIRKWQEN